MLQQWYPSTYRAFTFNGPPSPQGISPYLTKGVASDGTNIWVSDASLSQVAKLGPNGQLLAIYSIGLNPIALTFDGTNIWVVDVAGTIYKVLASTGAVVGTVPLGGSPVAIAFDGTNMWVANQFLDHVTKIVASTGQVIDSYPTGHIPTGVVFDGSSIWVANLSGSSVTRFSGRHWRNDRHLPGRNRVEFHRLRRREHLGH